MALTKVTGQVVKTDTDLTVGVITAVTATFTGNVSVAGTLTYDDVTNVDSVGLITARSGIDITGGGGLNLTGGAGIITATRYRVGTAATLDASGLSVSAGVVTTTTLRIGAGSTAAPSITPTGDTDTGIFFPSADTIAFGEGGSEAARIDSSGRFGIGTASPSARLEVSTGGGTEARITSTIDNNADLTFYTNSVQRGIVEGNSLGMLFGTTGALPTTFITNNTERARIDSSGRFGIGTTPAVELHVYKSSGTTTFWIESGDTQKGIAAININNSGYAFQSTYNTGGTAARPFIWYNVGTELMRLDTSGRLLIGYTSDNGAFKLQVNSQIFATSSTISTSDGRYKENVATLDGCVDLVKALRPVSFYWKPQQDITRIDEDGNEVLVREGHNFPEGAQVGFIAQEVQTVLAEKPWLTSVIKQNVRPAVTDNDGNELASEEEFLGIAEGNLIAVLTSALQEAIGRIEQLEATVATLQQS